jgi:hypothetical protein
MPAVSGELGYLGAPSLNHGMHLSTKMLICPFEIG